jgi:hypothetical protein
MEDSMTIVQEILARQRDGDYCQDLRELTAREWQRNNGWEMSAQYEFNCERIQLLRGRVRKHVRQQRLPRSNRTA